MCMSTPDAPAPPPKLPEAQQAAPTTAVDKKRLKAGQGSGFRSTILTGNGGLGGSSQKTLLGS